MGITSSRSGTSLAGSPWLAAVFTPLNRWTSTRLPSAVGWVKLVAWTHIGAATVIGAGTRAAHSTARAISRRWYGYAYDHRAASSPAARYTTRPLPSVRTTPAGRALSVPSGFM